MVDLDGYKVVMLNSFQHPVVDPEINSGRQSNYMTKIKPIKKLLIPAAGMGTRFLPVTKAQPKEMLPVLDKPVIQYVVEEAVASGITDIIFVSGPSKRPLEDHFDRCPELEAHLAEFNKIEMLDNVKAISQMANFTYVRQKQFYGNGYPILDAQHVLGNDPFAVVWGDEFFVGKTPRLKQLMNAYQQLNASVITAMPTDDAGTKKYGIIEGKEIKPGLFRVSKLVEKPGPQGTKSRLASLGGYILKPEIFKALEEEKKNLKPGEELYLSKAMARLLKRQPIYALLIEGKHYDAGSKLNWLKANVEMALANSEIGQEFKEYLTSLF